ncbi:MAG: hypothetical protein PHF86_05735 [Candidatus Nanoarchaeia archaeon]|nr:hypothetical protein [Candidatus Nanoarchaeia archaeon]
MEENKQEFKADIQELIPIYGLVKMLGINFDRAKTRNYTGLGGQFAKACELRTISKELGFNLITYSIYQATFCAMGVNYLPPVIEGLEKIIK